MEMPGFLDYRMPVASDLPMIETIIVEVPTPAPLRRARRRRGADHSAACGRRQRRRPRDGRPHGRPPDVPAAALSAALDAARHAADGGGVRPSPPHRGLRAMGRCPRKRTEGSWAPSRLLMTPPAFQATSPLRGEEERKL